MKYLKTYKILNEENSEYLMSLKSDFSTLRSILDDWEVKIKKLEKVDSTNVPVIDFTKIDFIVAAKKAEVGKLVDPTTEL